MNAAASQKDCALCESAGGEQVWQDDRCRVIRVQEREGEDYPGYCRVVWHAHVREMSDLPAMDRQHLMHVVHAVETMVRELYRPDKINLASLGNLTPHLHWHVIPRRNDDPSFPAPIWAQAHLQHSPDASTSPATSISTMMLRDHLLNALANERQGTPG